MKKSIFLIFVFLFGCTTTVVEKSNDNQKPISTNSSSLDLTNDPNNCGSEGYICVGGRSCVDSRCYPAWLPMSIVDAPAARSAANAGTINGKFVLTGGCESLVPFTTPTNASYQYDPVLDSWSPYPNLNFGRVYHSVVSTENGIFVAGGLDTCYYGGANVPSPEIIHGFDSSWQTVSTFGYMTNYNMGLVYTGETFLTFAGSNAVGPDSNNWSMLSLSKGWTTGTCDIDNCQRAAPVLFLDNDNVRVIGGAIGYGDAPNGITFNLKTNSWNKWNTPNGTPNLRAIAPSSENTKFADDGRRLFFPAEDGSVWVYDRVSNYWSQDTFQTAPLSVCWNGATSFVGSEMIVWGGNCNDTLYNTGARYQPPATN